MIALKKRHPGCRARAGMGVLEVLISLSIFAVVLSAFSASLGSRAKDLSVVDTEERINRTAENTIMEVRALLNQTQFRAGLPALFDDDTIGLTFPALAHAAADSAAVREVAFLMPNDLDIDGWPDVSAIGEIAWAVDPSALVLTAGTDGRNDLIFIDGETGARRRIASGIATFEVNDSASTGFVIPLNTLRVRFSVDRGAPGRGLSPKEFVTDISLSPDPDTP